MIQRLLCDTVAIQVSFDKHPSFESIYVKYIAKLAENIGSYQYYSTNSNMAKRLHSQHIDKYKILVSTYYFFILYHKQFTGSTNTIKFAIKRTNIHIPTKKEVIIKKDLDKLKEYLDYFDIKVNIIFEVNDLFRMLK
jgi:hypothetical protein